MAQLMKNAHDSYEQHLKRAEQPKDMILTHEKLEAFSVCILWL